MFDQEGHGSIPVQQLKRFLLQAQLGFQEEECKGGGEGETID